MIHHCRAEREITARYHWIVKRTPRRPLNFANSKKSGPARVIETPAGPEHSRERAAKVSETKHRKGDGEAREKAGGFSRSFQPDQPDHESLEDRVIRIEKALWRGPDNTGGLFTEVSNLKRTVAIVGAMITILTPLFYKIIDKVWQ